MTAAERRFEKIKRRKREKKIKHTQKNNVNEQRQV